MSDRSHVGRPPGTRAAARQIADRFWHITVLAVLLAALGVAGCRSEDPQAAAHREARVLAQGERSSMPGVSLIGIDGATWKVIDPLLARGELPNLARLIERGVRMPLRSQAPLLSPPVWTTIATGVARRFHGISNFTRDGRLISSLDRRVPALWSLASSFDKRAAVVGWWATYPAEAIQGAVISERALKTRERSLRELFVNVDIHEADVSRLVYPPSAFELLRPLLERAPAAEKGGDGLPAVDEVMTEDAAIAHALLALRKEMGPFDLEMILMRGVDVVSHFYWKFHEPSSPTFAAADRPPAKDVALLGSTINDYYVFVDGLLGELVDDDPNRITIVLSDHGFEAKARSDGLVSGDHKSEAALDGILVAAGGPLRQGARLEPASIFDVAPTVLYLLGLPVAKYMEGAVIGAAVEPAWLGAHPMRQVNEYEGPPVLVAGEENTESSADEAVLEQLRALGYLE
jgi:hypothetical protein